VDTLVNCQRRPLDELLAAVGVVAHVRTDATVDTFCSCQSVRVFLMLRPKLLTMTRKVTASREAFAAGRARESLWWARV
jgi:hypothetical protein